MNLKTASFRIALGLAAALLIGCGGGGSNAPRTAAPSAASPQLVYTDATAGTVRLVRDSALSTGTHLVLDVQGTDATVLSSGLFMTLSVEPSVATWSKVQPADPALVQNGTTYALGSGVPLMKAKASGGTLSFVVGQKDYTTAVATNGLLARVALDLQSGASAGTVAFNATVSGNKLLTNTGALADVTPGIGILKVQ